MSQRRRIEKSQERSVHARAHGGREGGRQPLTYKTKKRSFYSRGDMGKMRRRPRLLKESTPFPGNPTPPPLRVGVGVAMWWVASTKTHFLSSPFCAPFSRVDGLLRSIDNFSDKRDARATFIHFLKRVRDGIYTRNKMRTREK